MNSSQSKRLRGADEWIRRTEQAMASADGCDEAIVASTDLNTWELVLHLAQVQGRPRICLISSDSDEGFLANCQDIKEEFGLDPGRTCYLGFDSGAVNRKDRWPERDRWAISLADRILPISIHRGGRLESLLAEAPITARIDNSLRIEWKSAPPRPPHLLDRGEIATRFDAPLIDWLFHWTRASDGPWPGERRSEYYAAVLASGEEDPRSAERTLDRMTTEERIRASDWRVRGGERAVSFTDLPPSESERLFRWRKRYARFTAEPFGIALHPGAAREAGVCPVSYLGEGEEAAAIPVHLRQGAGRIGDWPREREHRHRGDLDLSQLPREAWKPVTLPLLPSLKGQ